MIVREEVENVAAASGFRADSIEKVMRLCRILDRLGDHPTTRDQWLLKGGTALNLLHLDVPRMSVDIDLNYVGTAKREAMLAARPGFEAALVAELQQHSDVAQGSDGLRDDMCRALAGIAARLFDWSPGERTFLDALHRCGRIEAAALHDDPAIQRRIEAQPMLLWKAQNVRAYGAGN